MILLSFIFGIFGSIYLLIVGDFYGAIGIWIFVGLWLWVWEVMKDAAKAVTGAFNQDTYNLTQNQYLGTESDDPTKPNENIPAIIEIGKHHYRKGG